MNWLNTVFLFLASFLAVFWQAAFDGLRFALGGQVDLLPSLIVFAALQCRLAVVTSLAIWSGMLFDSLSANPLGVTILPLLLVGVGIYAVRDLVLRGQVFAQVAIGFCASAAAPVLTVILLLTMGRSPVLGWGSLWQLLVISVAGGFLTPLWFIFFDWLKANFTHSPAARAGFRPDREIRRGH